MLKTILTQTVFFFFYARIDFKKHPEKGEIPD